METCENCGRKIGAMETAHVWQERIVCTKCHAFLLGKSPQRVAKFLLLAALSIAAVFVGSLLAGRLMRHTADQPTKIAAPLQFRYQRLSQLAGVFREVERVERQVKRKKVA